MNQRNQQHKSRRHTLRSAAALLLTFILALSCLTGCAAAAESRASKGDADSENAFDLRGVAILGDLLGLETKTAAETPALAPGESSGIKIGVSLWANDDPLSQKTIETIDRAAALLGVEVAYAFCGYDSRRIRHSVTNLIDQGCQGILLANRTDSDIAAAIRVCNEKGVYLAQLTHKIDEDLHPDTYALAQESPYYVGAVHGEEITASYRIVNALLEAGDRNIGYITWSESDTTQVLRNIGYHMATESFRGYNKGAKINLAEPVEAATAEEGYRVCKQMLEEDPDLEAILVSGGGGDVLDGVLAALSELGLIGVIDVAAFDATDSMQPLLTSGAVFAAASGTYCQGLYGFLMLRRAILENEPKPADQAGFDLTFVDLYMYTSTNGRNYDDSFVLDVPYTDAELLDLAGLSIADLSKTAPTLSLTDVLSRHATETFAFPSLHTLLPSDAEEPPSEEEQAEEAEAEAEEEAAEAAESVVSDDTLTETVLDQVEDTDTPTT